MREVVVDVDVGDVGCGCEKVAPLSHLGCANMTKWSVRSLRYINPYFSCFSFLGHGPIVTLY